MLTACWAAKGGSGTTVVACALATLAANRRPGGAVLCDLTGDAAACLGVAEPRGPGLSDFVAGLDTHAPDALGALLVPAGGALRLLPGGRGELQAEARTVRNILTRLAGRIVLDAGTRPAGVAAELVRHADRSLLVTRPCYLALRRALDAPVRPTGVVLVDEPGRALRITDVEAALDAPVVAVVPTEPAVARAVDAGLLARRLPRKLAGALADVA